MIMTPIKTTCATKQMARRLNQSGISGDCIACEHGVMSKCVSKVIVMSRPLDELRSLDGLRRPSSDFVTIENSVHLPVEFLSSA